MDDDGRNPQQHRTTRRASLVVPARPESVSLARLVGSAVAAQAAFSVHEVDDVRIAIGELCAAVVEMTPVAEMRVEFHASGGELCVEVTVPPTSVIRAGGLGDAVRHAVLAAVADVFSVDPEGSGVWFVKRAGSSPSNRSPEADPGR